MIAIALGVALLTGAFGNEPTIAAPRPGERVVFLGDSITYAGMYVRYLEGYLLTRFPDQRRELINLGLPSETVSGLSEPSHPYPRPNVHERLARVLKATGSTTIYACYGMNDGIYHPFSDDRLKAFQQAIIKLDAEIQAAGVGFVAMTPPPFDPRPIAKILHGPDADSFGYQHPFSGYDDVLKRYADWLVGTRAVGRKVIDLRSAITPFLEHARETTPDYTLAGDGVHMNADGHWLIARAILQAWNVPLDGRNLNVDLDAPQPGSGVEVTRSGSTWSIMYTAPVPFPWDPAFSEILRNDRQYGPRVADQIMHIEGLPMGNYDVAESGIKLGTFSAPTLKAGVNLRAFPALKMNIQSEALGKLIERRQRLMAGAWLTSVGHLRPDTAVGKPLDEAVEEAKAIDTQIGEMLKPVTLKITIQPADPT